jgi:thioredoxin-related protein
MLKLFSVISLFFLQVSVQCQTISLFNTYENWNVSIKSAEKNDKQILLYFGAPWCAPCNQLMKGVFSDPSTATDLKEKFELYAFDIDQPNSIPLRKKYRIIAVPRIVILNKSGYLKESVESIPQDFNKFIILMNNIAKSSRFYTSIDNNINQKYPAFYNDYFNSNTKMFPDSVKVSRYLNSQINLFSEVNWDVLTLFNYNEIYLDYILQNKDKFRQLYGNEVSFKIHEIYVQLGNKYIKSKDSIKFDKLILKLLPNKDSSYYDNALESYYMREISFLAKSGMDWPKFILRSKSFVDKFGDKSNHFICNYIYYSNCNDNSVYKFLLTLMPAVEKLFPNSESFLMYGSFLFKTRNIVDSRTYFQKAIDAAPTEELKKK